MRHRLAFPLALAAALAAAVPAMAQSASRVLTPDADGYVTAVRPGVGNSAARVLRVDGRPRVRAFIRFDLSAVPRPIVRARLLLRPRRSSRVGVAVHRASPGWSERTLRWAGIPRIGGRVTTTRSLTGGRTLSVDVTRAVGDGRFLALALARSAHSAVYLASREARSDGPRLVVTSAADAVIAPSSPSGGSPAREPAPGGGATPAPASAPTPPPPGAPHRIAAAGDIACGTATTSTQCEQMATSDVILGLAPAAVLALGDVQYELGELPDFQKFFEPSWGRLRSILHPAIGNHEYGDSDTAGCGVACGYFDYFNGAGTLSGPAGERGKGYYAFDVGSWRLYALNSNCRSSHAPSCAAGSAQEQWLRSDLAANPRACSLMFMHHPMWTSDTRDFDPPEMRAALRPMWDAFHEAGGDVVLAGHSHFYERFAPLRPDGVSDPDGIRQFIVGTGGRNVYGFGAIEPGSEVRNGSTFGALEMTLRAGSYDWRFVPIPGSRFTDEGTQACH